MELGTVPWRKLALDDNEQMEITRYAVSVVEYSTAQYVQYISREKSAYSTAGLRKRELRKEVEKDYGGRMG